jgi:hypothetical protein
MTNKIQLKSPEDVRRYVCRVLRTIQESGDEKVIENAGKISQLLGPAGRSLYNALTGYRPLTEAQEFLYQSTGKNGLS